MKKFFKKIGKGFRELGRGLKKIFNSKIGRILGTIALAIALPVMFNALFTGGVTTTTAAGETVIEGVVQSTTQEGVKQTVRGVTSATAKAVKAGVEVNNAAQAISVAERLKAVAIQTGELFRNPIQAVQRTFKNIMGTNPELLSSERATEFLEAINEGKGEMFLSTNEAGAITKSDIFSEGTRELSTEDLINNAYDEWASLHPNQAKASAIRLERSGLEDIAGEFQYSPRIDKAPISFQTERNLHTLMSHSTPEVQADVLGMPGIRDTWVNASIKTGRADLFPDPASFAGVRPYSSLGEAWTGGTGIKKIGRTADQIASSRLKDVLPFEYEGLASQANIVKVGKSVAATSSLLVPQDVPDYEQPHYNPYAPQQATAALDRASQYGMTPTYNEPIDISNIVSNINTNQNATSIYSDILNQNQAGMIYGPYSVYG